MDKADDNAPQSEKIRRGLQVIYEPHPVSFERKQFLRSHGYRIVDARFAPDGYEYPEDMAQESDAPAAATKSKAKKK